MTNKKSDEDTSADGAWGKAWDKGGTDGDWDGGRLKESKQRSTRGSGLEICLVSSWLDSCLAMPMLADYLLCEYHHEPLRHRNTEFGALSEFHRFLCLASFWINRISDFFSQ